MGTSAIIVAVLITTAVLLAAYGWKTFRTESSDGRIWAFAGMIFFPACLVYLAFQLAISPLP